MRIFRRVLLLMVVLGGVSGPAAAGVRSLPLDVDTAASNVDVTIAVGFLGASDQQTVSDVGFSGTVQTDVELVTAPGFGTVAETVRFVSGEVVAADTTFDQLQLNVGIPIDIVITTLGLSGSFDDDTLMTGAPTAQNTVPLDLTPIDLVFDMGSLAVTLTPPGDTTPIELSELALVFDLGQTGSVVTAGTQMTVVVPVDEVAMATAEGVDVTVTLAGDLILTGTIPPSEVPALSPLPGALALALLVAAGLATRRRRKAS